MTEINIYIIISNNRWYTTWGNSSGDQTIRSFLKHHNNIYQKKSSTGIKHGVMYRQNRYKSFKTFKNDIYFYSHIVNSSFCILIFLFCFVFVKTGFGDQKNKLREILYRYINIIYWQYTTLMEIDWDLNSADQSTSLLGSTVEGGGFPLHGEIVWAMERRL